MNKPIEKELIVLEFKQFKIFFGGENMAVDPICKMDVEEKSAKWVSEYKGKKYYFCAPGCKKEFDENPEKYAK